MLWHLGFTLNPNPRQRTARPTCGQAAALVNTASCLTGKCWASEHVLTCCRTDKTGAECLHQAQVAPQTRDLQHLGASFRLELPPLSLSVVLLDMEGGDRVAAAAAISGGGGGGGGRSAVQGAYADAGVFADAGNSRRPRPVDQM